MHDVVVIGAGPAGLHAAYRLASAGLDVMVIDAQKRIGENAVCSGVIGDEAFVRFGLPRRSILNRICCIQAISPAGRKLEHRMTAPLAYVVDKAEFNRDLGEQARAAGTEISLGRVVTTVDCDRDRVTLSFRSHGNTGGKLRARVAIIASGVNGALNSKLGLVKLSEFLQAIQADIPFGKDGAANPTELYVGRSIAPGAFGWKIPLGQGRVRVGLMSEENPRPYFNALLQRVAPELDQKKIVPQQKAIGQVPVGKCVADRIVVIGEAAGHVKTSTGGGIYYGLLSAEIAAETIIRAFQRSEFTVSTLGEFERLWRAAFGTELSAGHLARKMAARFPDSVIERIFENAESTDLLRRLNGQLKFDWHHQAILTSIRSLFVPSRKL
jgi:digeranylgeranylglycerophospholipid reductase